MADSSGKVAKLVQQKLEDYFNRQRVENEFDPSGKGIHTTTPLVVQLELGYLQAAEHQWKANKKKKNSKLKTLEQEEDSDEKVQAEDGESSSVGNELTIDVSPRVTRNSKIKSRVKGSEIDRITKNAQNTLNQISVDKIQSIHRYRPHLIPKEYLDLGKAAKVSHHVDAMLNTEHAWDCAEENDDRGAARKYIEEKNESDRKEREGIIESKMAVGAGNQRRKTPIWLRVELEKARKDAQLDKGSSQKQKMTEESRVNDSTSHCQETSGDENEPLVEERRDDDREIDKSDSEVTNAACQTGEEGEEKRIHDREKKEDSKKELNEGVNRLETNADKNNEEVDRKREYEKGESKNDQDNSTQSTKSGASKQTGKHNHSGRETELGNDNQKEHSPKQKRSEQRGENHGHPIEHEKQSDRTEGNSVQDARIMDGQVTHKMEQGDKASNEPRGDGLEEWGTDDGRKNGSAREEKPAVNREQVVKVEEYVRTESMVSLTNVGL